MRVLVELLGWTLDITLNPSGDDEPSERDHLGGTFEPAPPPEGDWVYPEDRFGLRGKR